MVAGFFKRYKQVVGYHLTGESSESQAFKQFILDLLNNVEKESNLIIDALVSDGGPANVALWNALGFKVTKNRIIYKIPHPVDPKRFLWLIVDQIHTFKNLINAFRNHKTARIPDEFVSKYNLKTNVACLDDIRSLLEYQQNMIYKTAPRLKSRHIDPSHFDTIRVGTSTALISDDIRSSLHYIDDLSIEQKEEFFEKSCKFQNANATSWFLDFIKKWFDIMRNRSYNKALNIDESDKMEQDFQFLLESVEFFQNLRFGTQNKFVKCQSFAIASTLSLIDLVRNLMKEAGFKCFIAARSNQDCMENVFSVMRVKHKKMVALQFKQNLLNHALSQYLFKPIKNSSYFWDDSSDEDNINILECLRSSKSQKTPPNLCKLFELDAIKEMLQSSEQFDIADFKLFSLIEMDRFIYIAGYILKRALKNVDCESCLNAAFSDGTDSANNTTLIKLRENYDGALKYPSNDSIELLLKLEKIFQNMNSVRHHISNIEMEMIFIEFVSQKLTNPFALCHHIDKKIISTFFNFRYYISRATVAIQERNYASLSMNN